jgi:hypothetical protein
MPYRRRPREIVDPGIDTGSDAICGRPLFVIPRAEIRLQNQGGSL